MPRARLQMLFRDAGGRPLPIMPRDGAGRIRRPDGRAILSLDQAAARFRESRRVLAARYADRFAGD